VTRQQRLRVTVAVIAACSGLPLAYSVLNHSAPRHAPLATGPVPSARAGAREPDAATVLQVMPAPYQLPAAVSRAVVLPDAGNLLIAGGLTPSGASADTVTSLDPVTGATRPAGRLAQATHDAAGFVVGGRMFVLGGGTATSVPTIQAFTPGTDAAVTGALNHRRSDSSGVSAGPAGYLVGGYDGTTVDPQVLGTTDGQHFRAVARLAVPVRYAGTAAMGGLIWLFGGQTTAATTAAGATDVIQRIDPATGTAAVVGHLPQPVQGATAFSLGGRIYVAGGATSAGTSRTVFQFDPATSRVRSVAELPVPVGYAAAAVAGGAGYLIGGEDGSRPVPTVTTFRLVAGGQPAAPWLAPAGGPGQLAPGSDPAVLPADVLIADHHNNRLLIVDPQGRIRWQFPRPGNLAPGQTFLQPDDAFFSPDGKYIIVTQEDDQLVSLISVATSKIVYRYGVPGAPGAGPDHLSNPDDAMLIPGGAMLVADIKNCRIVVITPPARTTTRVIGQTAGGCEHDPPRRFGSPNGAFPLTDGNYLVTEINGDWADEMSLGGRMSWSAHPPGVLYPSDSNEVYPGRYLTADYSDPGQVAEFTSSGRVLWRMGGFNQPSLALPLPNGDILLNDDFNHRVCVVDPAANRIVWQYGHTGVAGRAPGYLSDPDGVDLVPPDSLLVTHAATMGALR
jgi:DNA-binding beta-propeller fold protein YncE